MNLRERFAGSDQTSLVEVCTSPRTTEYLTEASRGVKKIDVSGYGGRPFALTLLQVVDNE